MNRRGEVEDSEQMEEGAGTNEQVAADANKAHGEKTQATEAQEKKWPTMKVEGVGEQLLYPIKELTRMKDYI